MTSKDLKTLAQEAEAKVNAAKAGAKINDTSSNTAHEVAKLKGPVKSKYTLNRGILKGPSVLNEEADLSNGRISSNGQTGDDRKD